MALAIKPFFWPLPWPCSPRPFVAARGVALVLCGIVNITDDNSEMDGQLVSSSNLVDIILVREIM